MHKILGWVCFGCAAFFALLSLVAVFAGSSLGVGTNLLIYAAVFFGVIGILTAVALVVVGRLE